MNVTSAARLGVLLGTVSAAEILRLPSNYDDDPPRLAHGLSGEVLRRVADRAAEDLAALVVSLPAAEQMRCHVPRYAIRFLTGGGTVAIALCFRCNNARVLTESEEGWFTFDGQSAEASRLLDRLRGAAPLSGPK